MEEIRRATRTLEKNKRKMKKLEESNPWLGNVKGLIKKEEGEVRPKTAEAEPTRKRKRGEEEMTTDPFSDRAAKRSFTPEEKQAYQKMSQELNRLLQRAKSGKQNSLEETERVVREAAVLKRYLTNDQRELLGTAAEVEGTQLTAWQMEATRNIL